MTKNKIINIIILRIISSVLFVFMSLKAIKFISMFTLLVITSGCLSGTMIKDVDFPATPVDMTKITKMGKACFSVNIGSRGNGSIIQAAKNGNISTIRMVEYGTEFKHGGLTQQSCTYVYGD